MNQTCQILFILKYIYFIRIFIYIKIHIFFKQRQLCALRKSLKINLRSIAVFKSEISLVKDANEGIEFFLFIFIYSIIFYYLIYLIKNNDRQFFIVFNYKIINYLFKL